MIKVAQILGPANAGGVESMIMNLYKNIDRTKVQFDFFVENTCPIIDQEVIEKLGGKVVIIPKYTKIFHYMKTLKRLFKEGQYDVVHSNVNALSIFPLRAAKKAGIKIRIAHSHSTANKKEWKKTLIKNMLRPFSRVYPTHYFACSELAGKWLFGKKKWNSGQVYLINNAVDLEKFKFDEIKRNEIRKQLNIVDNFVIGHIGRFMQQKNHTFLIDIFHELVKQKPDAKLLLVGDGPLKEQITEKVKNLHIENNVLFLGLQKRTQDFYQAMDCFLLPSLYEGLPVVGVESQANGLNCFFADTITKETKVNENVKYLSLQLSAKQWADEIISSTNNNINRLLGYENLKNSQFNISSEAKKLLNKYEEILQAK